MSRVHTLHNRGEVESHADVARRLEAAGDYVLVRRGVPRSIVMSCPDGCGEMLTVNLDPRSGKAWRIDTRMDKVTLYPSIWRQQGCRAHFIVWRNAVIWCDIAGDERIVIDEDVVKSVQRELQNVGGRFVHYETFAATASVHPWEALWAGQVLKYRGLANEGEPGYFAAVKAPPERRGTWA